MKKSLLLTALALFTALSVSAQIQASLLGNWHDEDIPPTTVYDNPYNEVWGFAINGLEYAIIGSTEGMHIINVTNPNMPEESFRIPGASSGDFLIHRDFKTYKGYLYCVADEYSTSKLQIIDLNDLPNSATEVYSSNEFVVTAHNLFIDTSQAVLYLLGASGSTILLDISIPDDPQFIASYNPGTAFSMPYVHDAYIKDNIGFFNCGNGGGLRVVDFTDPLNPMLLGTLTNYPESGYNHSGWLSDDEQYYYLCDETHGTGIKIVDVSDFSDMQVVAIMQPNVWTNEIPHNCIYRDGLLYVSYYYDGLQVFDVSDPFNPVRVAYYDTSPLPNTTSYAGAWGVNPMLPSGNILISDMQEGLFVFEALGDLLDLSLHPSDNQFESCTGEEVVFTLTVGEDFEAGGVALSMESNLPGATATFEPNPAQPGETVTVTLSGLPYTQGSAATIAIHANDGINDNTVQIFVQVENLPGEAPLVSPFPGASNVAVQPLFDWDAATNANSYILEIATDAANFESSIVYTNTTSSTQMLLASVLDPASDYHWRVTAQNDCGGTPSVVQTFTTEGGSSTHFLESNSLTVFPNPAGANLIVSFEKPMETPTQVVLNCITGQVLLQNEMPVGGSQLQFQTASLPAGVYLLKLTNGDDSVVRRVAVQH